MRSDGGPVLRAAERMTRQPVVGRHRAEGEPPAPGPARVERYAAWLVRRWPYVVAGWLLVLVAAGAGAGGLTQQLSGGGWYVPGSPSLQVLDETAEGFVGRGPTTLTLVTRDERVDASDPAFADRAEAAYRFVVGQPGLHVRSEFGYGVSSEATQSAFVGDSGRTTSTMLGLDLSDGDARRELPAIQHAIDERFGGEGMLVSLVGPATVWGEVNVLSEHGLLRAELLALPLLVVVMLWLYRGWVAAGLSLCVAATCVVGTLGVLSLLVRFVDLSVFVQNAATMLGLGVAVDYSLFLISRFREQLQGGQEVTPALAETLRTAGHTVVSSGTTVVLAMSTLLLIDLSVIRSIGIGAVVVVTAAMIVNLLVLPALLVPLAHRVAQPAPRHRRTRASADRWPRWAALVMRRPVVALFLGLAVLLVLAAPAVRLSTFTPDARIIPTTATVRAGWDALRSDYGPASTSPILVAVRSDRPVSQRGDLDRLDALTARLAELPGVSAVRSPTTVLRDAGAVASAATLSPDRRAALPPDLARAVGHLLTDDARTYLVEVETDSPPASAAARDLVDDVRDEARHASGGGFDIAVGGETAEGIDSTRTIANGLPKVAGTMLLVIYVVLLLTFRSVFLPLKAILLNAASVAATYGVLVVVFQDGWGAGILGFEATGQVTNFVPVLLLTLLFSLSTDYEVFLLGRVREEWQASGDDRVAVARGLALTAPLISGAAMLMVAVFSAFALASVLPVQELGLGMAVAIVVDATLVRLVLVPASMRLMGRWNWWFPRLPALGWPPHRISRSVSPRG